MLSINKKMIFFMIFSMLMLHVGTLDGHAEAAKDNYKEHFNNIASMFSEGHNPDTKELIENWSDYLAARKTHTNRVYMSALQEMVADYHTAVSRLSDCMNVIEGAENRNHPVWLDDIVKQFGVDFVKKNEKAILSNFQAIIANYPERTCGEVRQKLIYMEARVHGAYRHYFKLFLAFYHSLDAKGQETLRSRQKAAVSFMTLMEEGSFYRLFFDIEAPRQKLTEIEAREQNKELYSFFVNHPIAVKNFDFSKAINDLKKITRTNHDTGK